MSASSWIIKACASRPCRLLLSALFVLCLWAGAGRAVADGSVSLVLSGRGTAYMEVVEAFKASYGISRPVRLAYADALASGELRGLVRDSALVVPVGLGATRLVSDNYAGNAQVLALLVPRSGFDGIVWPSGPGRRMLSAVFIDQPVGRSLALLGQVLPTAKRVGVVMSGAQQSQLADLQRGASRYGLRLVSRVIDDPSDIAPALRMVLQEADVMLLQPDALIVNASNVQNVLLTTYRFRVPVIGFSEGLVRAGAVAAVYATTAQIGHRGGLLAAQWAKTGELPPPMYCKEFSVTFNPHVARSLGLTLPDEADVAGRLEGTP